MTRDDGRDARAGTPEDEGGEELAADTSETSETPDAATAETRVLNEEDAAELETRLVLEDASAPDVASRAEGPAAGHDLPDEDDRTQLVTRLPGSTAGGADSHAGNSRGVETTSDEQARVDVSSEQVAPLTKRTRVLDPSIVAADSTGDDQEVGVSAEAETRLLDEPDKTSPPAVSDAASDRVVRAAAPLAAGIPAARPANPTPIDSERGLMPGTVLFGEYEIVNVLGVGGMGEVYRAKHRRLEEHRAIKVMHAELSKKKGASEFFYREAKALLAVRHPAVVHCHDLLSDDAGRVYLIMEMIEGIPLSKKMNDGPLSPDDVAILGARVSHGLAAAHRKGVIHRDVSPDNIVLPNGRVQEAKIIDFGIAKLLEDGEGTIVDGFKGKLSYASPEQLGFFGGKIDGRSDFYSLGLVLVAAALGRPMSMGTTVVEAVDARRSFSHLPDAIPVGLRSAIQPLLALDPDDRPKYVDRLFVVPGGRDGASDTGPITTGGIDRSGGPKKQSRGRSGLIAGGAVAAAVLLAGGGFFMGGLPGVGENATQPKARALAADSAATSGGSGSDSLEAAVTTALAPLDPKPVVQENTPVVEAKKSEAPRPRRVTASDRIKIIGLINNAKLALQENRLMSPANDNAYDRYVRVLELDPNESRAKAGLREVAVRYVGMADRAIDKGDLAQARSFVDRARRADASFPGIAALESRLSNQGN